MSIEQRLQYLERCLSKTKSVNKLLGTVTASAVVLVGAQLLRVSNLGQTAYAAGTQIKTLSAEQIVIVDEKGEKRVLIGTVAGHPRMDFIDSDGQTALTISLTERGDGVCFFDQKGKPRGVLGFKKDSGPCLEMFDDKGQSAMRLLVTPTGPGLTSISEKGNPKTMFVLGREQAKCLVFGEKGSGYVNLIAESAFSGVMIQNDKSQMVTMLGNDPAKRGLLGLGDEEGKLRVQLSLDEKKEGTLVFYDENHKSIKAWTSHDK